MNTVPDLSAMVVRVRDAVTGLPVPGATVRAWTVRRGGPVPPPLLFSGNSDAEGEVIVDWQCGFTCFGNFQHLKAFKVEASGYHPEARWQSVFDAQKVRMVQLEGTMTLEIPLQPL